MNKTVKLRKAWGEYKAGKRLHVLGENENPRPGAIDSGKAETLAELGYLDDGKRKKAVTDG